ncbi:divergent polysaccharide deacetylase family protein [Denitrobaculum tricleocarpae]|uniref:Divergent polysaccharide deacetylase family protein n=1 Tax=Denitrobaculum tricleocarpae TaxID=2591009 RepID=A0A545TPK0_9PROT|nr:divergent polysaccharide deacetylase family protein [Denitrobaculum tricleocarpae]TQV79143.1 divergent polysaccharide deacetylase family protein [Denitrobaculum tricleocarpae]
MESESLTVAGKAKKKQEKQRASGPRALSWLKILLPALALPVVVIGGLYAGVVLLDEAAEPPEPEVSPAAPESPTESAASSTAEPQTALVPRPQRPVEPLDMDKLRITDTVVSDTRVEIEKLPGNSQLDSVPQEKTAGPEVVQTSEPDKVPSPVAGPETPPEPQTEIAAIESPATLQNPVKPETSENQGQAQVIPPLWLRNATAPRANRGQPMIAVVIDDIGPNLRNARRSVTLPAPLTLAFLPYANHLEDLTTKASQAGHELMVHMPMEPKESSQNPGENALLTELGPEELKRRIRWNLERFSGYVGVNNHMGSKFTGSGPGMRLVMSELSKRGLLFLDSRTNAQSQAEQAAALFRVPFAQRDIFIDNDHTNPDAIRAQLAKLEEQARSRGYAVGISHPHDKTLEVLAEWLPEARKRGFALVPISEIVKQRLQLARAGAAQDPNAGSKSGQP